MDKDFPNPFEVIDARLSLIEQLLIEIKHGAKSPVGESSGSIGRTLNIQQAADFIGMTVQTVYRKTSKNEIPHFKKSGRVFFDSQELDGWLKSHRVPTKSDLQKLAGEHIADRARRPR